MLHGSTRRAVLQAYLWRLAAYVAAAAVPATLLASSLW